MVGVLSIAILLSVAALPPAIASGTLGPPYHGSSATVASTGTFSGCSRVHQLRVSGWNSTTGRLVSSVDLTATTCAASPLPGQPASSQAQWYGAWDILVPIHLPPRAASVSVNASWSFAWSVTDSYSVTKNCSGALSLGARSGYLVCNVDASVSFDLLSFVVDLTSGSYYAASAFFPSLYNFSFADGATFCNPTCSHSNLSSAPTVSTNASSTFTFPFVLSNPNGSHRWALVVFASAHVFTSVSTVYRHFTSVVLLAATSKAAFDFASGGRGGALTSIVIR